MVLLMRRVSSWLALVDSARLMPQYKVCAGQDQLDCAWLTGRMMYRIALVCLIQPTLFNFLPFSWQSE